ncbi:MAG: pentapeptide repeat-containing protein [Planctomycetota bacterium]|nr:pentapeptide repeat-containing protein [Planctomycetota bacterium]
MHRITLTIILLFSATAVDAAWYQKTDGTIVDPIQDIYGAEHSLDRTGGKNLEPGVDLEGTPDNRPFLFKADLRYADLSGANLTYTYLDYANLIGADLSGANLLASPMWAADLTGANLSYADLSYTSMVGTDLTGADLSGSDLGNIVGYDVATWTDAFYYTDNEPTWDSGMDAAWRTSVGILAVPPTNAVPEPSTLLLALLGLALLPRRRRR